jgi:hypothetical protein
MVKRDAGKLKRALPVPLGRTVPDWIRQPTGTSATTGVNGPFSARTFSQR